MKKTRVVLLIVFCVLQSLHNFSQERKKSDSHIANSYFISGNYEAALEEYSILLEQDSLNDRHYYNIAICYLNSNIDKSKAIPYLEALKRKSKFDPNVIYLLGRAYHYAYRFDDAIAAYHDFKSLGKGNTANLEDVDRQVQYCMNAKELMKYPVDLKFENLGPTVNSSYADYYPFVPTDESFIVFNTNRPTEKENENNEEQGKSSSIYISKVTDGLFSKSIDIGPPIVLSEGNQEVIGLSANGETMLLYHVDNNGSGDIYWTKTDKNKSFKAPEKLNENINSKNAEEIAASISPDGMVLYFASNRKGGLGGTDIYASHKLPNGKWGVAQNLGPTINTPFDEDFPNISADGKVLFFSSNGHNSMGGFDIFKADFDQEIKQFKNPVNIGYPINTPEDNTNFRMSSNGRYGYISALRHEGLGDLDIYRVTFKSVEPKYSVINGTITSSDSTHPLNYGEVSILVKDAINNNEIGSYVPNPHTGRYVVALPPGSYKLEVTASGFESVKEEIAILDKSSYKFEITKDISLHPGIN
jgi:hypothetical protein